jgi:hypothetical protein
MRVKNNRIPLQIGGRQPGKQPANCAKQFRGTLKLEMANLLQGFSAYLTACSWNSAFNKPCLNFEILAPASRQHSQRRY